MPLTVVPMLALLLAAMLLLGWMVRRRRAGESDVDLAQAPVASTEPVETGVVAPPAPVTPPGTFARVDLGIPPWEVAAAEEAAARRAALETPAPVAEPSVVEPEPVVVAYDDAPAAAPEPEPLPAFGLPAPPLPVFEIDSPVDAEADLPIFDVPSVPLGLTDFSAAALPEVEPLVAPVDVESFDPTFLHEVEAEPAPDPVAAFAFGSPITVDVPELPELLDLVDHSDTAERVDLARQVAEYVPSEAVAPEPVRTPPAPVAPVAADADPADPAGQVDHTAHAYAELSRSLARAGRLREATLAQWAADLRVLGPLLAGRNDELCDALAGLAPADAGMAIAGARAVASSLVGPSIAVTAMLQDASHLSAHEPTFGRPSYAAGDVSADVLPDALVHALGAVLQDSAAQAGDTSGVSVGLRCDLVAQVAADPVIADASPAEVTDVVRGLLEPHERSRFDAAVVGTGWAS